jgi:hypothetical protein
VPKRSAEQRIEKYRTKLDPDWVKKALEQRRDSMLTAQTSSAERQAAMELRVKAVLNDEDITIWSHVLYLDYARELDRLIARHHGGPGLTREARIRVYAYKERGGSEPILKRIAYEAFGLTV